MSADMNEAHVAAAERLFAAGGGVDAVLECLRAAGLKSLMLIKALREVTGLGLQDTIRCVEPAPAMRS